MKFKVSKEEFWAKSPILTKQQVNQLPEFIILQGEPVEDKGNYCKACLTPYNTEPKNIDLEKAKALIQHGKELEEKKIEKLDDADDWEHLNNLMRSKINQLVQAVNTLLDNQK